MTDEQNIDGSAEEIEAQAPDVIRLKHVAHELDVTLHFYDGEIAVQAGVAEFPADRPEWARWARVKGYRLDPDSGQEIDDWEAYLDGTWVSEPAGDPVPFVPDHPSRMTVGPEEDLMGNAIGAAVASAVDEAEVEEGAESATDESAESAGDDTDASADGGRQPADADGVRESSEDSSGSVPGDGLGSGVGDGAADAGETDGAAA
jgi:hypothetical protein